MGPILVLAWWGWAANLVILSGLVVTLTPDDMPRDLSTIEVVARLATVCAFPGSLALILGKIIIDDLRE